MPDNIKLTHTDNTTAAVMMMMTLAQVNIEPESVLHTPKSKESSGKVKENVFHVLKKKQRCLCNHHANLF